MKKSLLKKAGKAIGEDIEEEIRPVENQKKNFLQLEKDIKELLLPVRKEFLLSNCPNCNCKNSKEEFKKGIFSFFKCPGCGTVFVNPRPSKKLLDNFYAKSKAIHGTTQTLITNEKGRAKHIFTPRAKIIIDFLKKMGKIRGDLLEVGCSIGTMLSIVKQKSDFNVFGVDPSFKALEISKKRGLKVYPETIEEFNPGEKQFDVVMSFETIEHLFWPIDFLSKVNKVMKRDGYFIFSTPNYHGFDIATLGIYYKRILAPNHLNYFNVDSIDEILRLTGFKVKKKMTPGILDLINVKKQIEDGSAPQVCDFTKYLLFSCSTKTQNKFQSFLSRNCLSGNMLVFAQKIN